MTIPLCRAPRFVNPIHWNAPPGKFPDVFFQPFDGRIHVSKVPHRKDIETVILAASQMMDVWQCLSKHRRALQTYLVLVLKYK